jgi:endonuclease/exonuclease/phosphatase family metal-dependent hydrolase
MWARVNVAAGFTVANFNGHAGVDGWGKPYDFAAACRAINADVLVLPELFVPDEGDEVGPELGEDPPYRLISTELAHGRVVHSPPPAHASRRWGPPPLGNWPRALRLDGPAQSRRRALRPGEQSSAATRGSWRLGLASRLPILEEQILELPRLRRDAAVRRAIIVRVAVGESTVVVAGVHLGHVSHGAWRQVRAIGHALTAEGPGVLVGDMNCWGPPLLALLPGWRRAVVGRTWPAWRPNSQIDHVLVRQLAVLEGKVLPAAGSDHRPVRASLALSPGNNTGAAAASAKAAKHP